MSNRNYNLEVLEPQLLYESRGRTIHLERTVTPEIVEFLTRIQFGYVGTLYEHCNTDEIIATMIDPHVLVVRIDGQLAITCLFSRRILEFKGKPLDFYYIRYLAADEQYHGRGTVVKFGAIAMNWMRKVQQRPAVYYNFVEQNHQSSFRFVQFVKFKQVGNTKTIGFSCVFPKKLDGLEKINNIQDDPELFKILTEHYSNYNAFNLVSLKPQMPYYIYRKNGEIIAGVQPHKAEWVLKSLPGWWGKMAIKIIPHIPFLNRIINPKDFRFLGFEGFYFKKGHVNDFIRLLEGVFYDTKLYSSLMWLDEKDPQLTEILKQNLGLVYHFAKGSNSRLMISFKDISEEDQKELLNRPFYVSALDNL